MEEQAAELEGKLKYEKEKGACHEAEAKAAEKGLEVAEKAAQVRWRVLVCVGWTWCLPGRGEQGIA
jgi:hypothetical protein